MVERLDVGEDHLSGQAQIAGGPHQVLDLARMHLAKDGEWVVHKVPAKCVGGGLAAVMLATGWAQLLRLLE